MEFTLVPPPRGLAVKMYCGSEAGFGRQKSTTRVAPLSTLAMPGVPCMHRVTNQPQTSAPWRPALLKVTPLGGAAVALPPRALLAAAVSSTGAPRAGMSSGRLLELGTGLPLTRPVAVTT